MRRCCAIVALALVVLAGCGGDDDSDNNSNPLADQVATWRFAQLSYNALLQSCQVDPRQKGVIAACTRSWREGYARETARLRRLLQAQQSSSPQCEQAVAQTKAMIDELTPVFDRTYINYVKAERARNADTTYTGPAIIPLLVRAKKGSDSAGREARRLAAAIRTSCDA